MVSAKCKVFIKDIHLIRDHGHAEQDVHLEVEESSARRRTLAEHDRKPGHERPRGGLRTGKRNLGNYFASFDFKCPLTAERGCGLRDPKQCLLIKVVLH